jgi:hypothetical protein
MLVRLALDELDAVIDQIGVEVFDLLLAELDLVEPRGDLVIVEYALLEAFLNELLELFDLGERDFDGEHRPPLSRAGGLGARPTQTREEAVAAAPSPAHSRARRGC